MGNNTDKHNFSKVVHPLSTHCFHSTTRHCDTQGRFLPLWRYSLLERERYQMCYIRKLLCMKLLGPNSKCNWHRGAIDDGKTGKQHLSWLWSSSRQRQQHRGVGPSLPAREIWLVGASYVFHSSFPPPFLPLSPCLSIPPLLPLFLFLSFPFLLLLYLFLFCLLLLLLEHRFIFDLSWPWIFQALQWQIRTLWPPVTLPLHSLVYRVPFSFVLVKYHALCNGHDIIHMYLKHWICPATRYMITN